MRYITLEGCFSMVNVYHFFLLNHFRDKKKIPFPFYLLASLESRLKDHKRNPKNLVLHVGIILLITYYAKSFEVVKIISTPKGKQLKPTKEYDMVSKEESVSKKGKKRKIVRMTLIMS